MELKRAKNPFRFYTESSLIELTGWMARDLNEMLAILKSAPPAVIYYHTHHFLKQHQYLSPEPTNDFAYWVTHVLQEERLGEQLAAIDTVRFTSIKSLRDAIISTMEEFLSKRPSSRSSPEGETFYFLKSKSFVLPTPHVANDLKEFSDCIASVSIHSLYHHIFESRLRLEKGTNDLSNWLSQELGEKSLAQSLDRLDPYTHTLEGLRLRILHLVGQKLFQKPTEAKNAN